MIKLQRNYILVVETDIGLLTIKPPFSLEFDITRNDMAATNISSLKIYNLSATNRELIRKDEYSGSVLRKISLKAGYGNNLSTVAVGNINHAWSERVGTNWITQIESFDGGYAETAATYNTAHYKGALNQGIPANIIASMKDYDISLGAIGNYPGKLVRGNAMTGNAFKVLKEFTGNEFFVDNGIAHCLGDSEAILGENFIIDSSTGLLGTPKKDRIFFRLSMIFEPRLHMGQVVTINSNSGINFAGTCKVVSLKHHGMISPTVCGDATTEVGLLPGTFILFNSATAPL